MNETRHKALLEFEKQGYKISLKADKLNRKVLLVVTNPNNCELPKYDYKGRFKRIIFYNPNDKKAYDYSSYELIAHVLKLDYKLKWCKNNIRDILKPAIKNFILED